MPATPLFPTIFVVDDDEGLLHLIAEALQRENYSVATACSGAAGLEWLKKNSADLLLLDLQLRDIEGTEFIGALPDLSRSIPFIIMTGQGDERVAVDMMKRGALDYLVKDMNFIEFMPMVVRNTLESLGQAKELALAKEARQQAERQAASDLEAMVQLQRLGTLFVRHGKMKPILVESVKAAMAISRADFGGIQLVTTGGKLEIVAQWGFRPWWVQFWNEDDMRQSACGKALESRQRIIVEDVERSPIFAGTAGLEILRRAGVRAVQSTPLVSRTGKLLGIFSTHYKAPHRPDDRTLRLLDLLTRQTADIIDRQQREEALRASHDRMKKALEIETVGVMYWDVAAGRLIDANETFLKLIGYTRAEVESRELTWQKLTPPELLDESLAELRKFHTTGRFGPYEKEYLCKDGTRRWFVCAGSSLGDNLGVKFCVDITIRKRAEAALRQSEERYRTLFNTLLEGFCIIDVIFDAHGRAVDYRFLEVNPAFEKQTGWRDPKGKLISELAPDNEAYWFEIYGKIALTGEPARFENVARALNRWYEVSAFRFGGAGSRKVAILFNDITESKRAQEALRASEERERERAAKLAAILEAVPTPVLIADDSDCLHIAGNRAAAELLGVPPDAALSLTAPEGIRLRHFKAVKDGRTLATDELPCQRAARGFPVQNFEFSLVFDDGTTREMLAYATPLKGEEGRPHGAVTVLVDITGRKQAELTRSRLAAIVENSGDAIIGRTLDGTIRDWNRGAEAIFGYSAEEIIGRPFSMLVPANRQGELRHLDEQIRRGEFVPSFETIHIRKDLMTFDVTVQVSPIRDTAGNIMGASAILRDNTERKRLAKEIVEVSERERRNFGQDLHDGLGQRLTGLEMLSHALAADLKPHSLKAAKEALRLNRELRKTVTEARLIAHGLAPVPIGGEGLMHALKTLAASTSRIPKVACRLTCSPPVRMQDVTAATHLYRIAQEAVHNALKHGRAKEVHITLAEGSEGVELAIENNGRVFSAANREQHGMGLSVMRHRAEMIGAKLSIESGERKGVKVSCTLPRKT